MTWKILVSAPYMQPVIDRFRPLLQNDGIPFELVIPPVEERLSEDALLNLIGDIDGVICGDDSFTDQVLRTAKQLRVISKWGTGIDSIDRESANRLGIAVRNTPDAFTEPVADTVLGYITCFARALHWMDQDIRAGHWVKRQGISLSEATLGIIGIGNVGKAIARRAHSFGMTILGNDIAEISGDVISETDLEAVSKEYLISTSDFITLNCDLNPSSRHIIGKNELEQMKPTSYLINAARGPLIDEAALAEALQQGGLAGAALDVFEVEPLPKDSPLLRLNNCLLAPHNANSSPAAYERVHENTIHNLLDGLLTTRN